MVNNNSVGSDRSLFLLKLVGFERQGLVYILQNQSTTYLLVAVASVVVTTSSCRFY